MSNVLINFFFLIGSRGRGDLFVSTDSGRRPKEEKTPTSSRAWAIQSDNNITNTPTSSPITPDPVKIARESPAKPISIDFDEDEDTPKKNDPETLKWEYINDDGGIEGPYEVSTMQYWLMKSYLPPNLQVKTTLDDEYMQLSHVLADSPIPFHKTVKEISKQYPRTKSNTKLPPKSDKPEVEPVPTKPVTNPEPTPEPVKEDKPEPVANQPDSFNFATLLGISPEEVSKASKSANEFGFDDAPVWSVDQIEKQWRPNEPTNPVSPMNSQFSAWRISNEPQQMNTAPHSIFTNESVQSNVNREVRYS